MSKTLQEASYCPRCQKAGERSLHRAFRDNSKLYIIKCLNGDCSWYNTGWAVQVDSDGQVYEREIGPRGMDKTFPTLSPDQLAYGQRLIEDIKGEDLR